MNRSLLNILATVCAVATTTQSTVAATCQSRLLEPTRLATVATAFEAHRPKLETSLKRDSDEFSPNRLYDLQMMTAPLLQWAAWYGYQPAIEKLALLYDGAYVHLSEQSAYVFNYLCDGMRCPRESSRPIAPTRMWTYPPPPGSSTRYESLLDSSQFAFAIARVISYAASTPRVARGEILTSFANRWVRVLLDDHYVRWVLGRPGESGIWQRAGWQCGFGNFTAEAHWRNLADSVYGTSHLPAARPVKYCNAISDQDTWVVAGVAELLMAHAADSQLVPISASIKERLRAFVHQAVTTMDKRTALTKLTDASGQLVYGRVFDPGSLDEHPENSYSGDEDLEYPGWRKAGENAARVARRASGTGWDLSHGRRLVTLLDTLRRATVPLGTTWPRREDMTGFARQFAFGVARQVPTGQVKFTNYLDGSNGWYRVNYASRPGFGYPPFGLSEEAARSGYGFWGAYELAALVAVQDYVKQNLLPLHIMVEPGLEALDSEPQPCPPGQTISR